MKSKQDQIKDVLERHYHGRNQLEERCSLDLLILFEGWRTDKYNGYSDSLKQDDYNDDDYDY